MGHSRTEILVVEDDQATLAALVELLETAGYHVKGAATFEEGRRSVDAVRPHLLITDVRLGCYNGLQLAIRARARDAQLPVIVLTGFPDGVVRAETERLGGIYLEKPLHADSFRETIRHLVAPERQAKRRDPVTARRAPLFLRSEGRLWGRSLTESKVARSAADMPDETEPILTNAELSRFADELLDRVKQLRGVADAILEKGRPRAPKRRRR